MLERQFLDLKNGVFYSFVLRHPKSANPELVIQPPEGHVGKDAPTFDANEVFVFLDEVCYWAIALDEAES